MSPPTKDRMIRFALVLLALLAACGSSPTAPVVVPRFQPKPRALPTIPSPDSTSTPQPRAD